MKNSKIWNPEKIYFVILLPPMAHKSNGGINGSVREFSIFLFIEFVGFGFMTHEGLEVE